MPPSVRTLSRPSARFNPGHVVGHYFVHTIIVEVGDGYIEVGVEKRVLFCSARGGHHLERGRFVGAAVVPEERQVSRAVYRSGAEHEDR